MNDIATSERVAMLSLAEEGAYRRAIDWAWKEGSVPSDPKLLARRIGKRCTVAIAKKVLMLFEKAPRRPDRAISPKLEKVRAEQYEKYMKNVRAGQARAAQKAAQKTEQESKRTRTSPEFEQNSKKLDANANLAGFKKTEIASKNKGPASGASSGAKIWLQPDPSHSESESESEEDKKKEKNKAIALFQKKGSRIPDEFFVTAEMRSWAETKCPNVDWESETEKFCNYWRAKTGKDATKLDWILTWKNWLFNARDRYGVSGNGKHRGDHQNNRATDVGTIKRDIERIQAKHAARRGDRDSDLPDDELRKGGNGP